MAVSATLGNGSSVIAWQTGDGILFQRVDSSGIPLSGPISAGNGPTFWTSIAADANGGFTLIWDAASGSSPMAQDYNANGAAVSESYVLTTAPAIAPLVSASVETPAIASMGANLTTATTLLPNGDTVVVTDDNPGVSGQWSAQQYDPSGNAIGPATSESFSGIGGLGDFETVALAGGSYVLTYRLESNYSSTLYYDLFRPDGIHSPERMAATASGLTLIGAHGTAALPDGGFVMDWVAPATSSTGGTTPPNAVFVEEFKSDGSAAGAARMLDFLPPNSTTPETIVSANGSYTVSWTPGGKGTPEAFTFTEQGAAAQNYSNDAIFTPAANYVLPAGPHSVTLVGSAAQTVTGNELGDTIVSNDQASTLIGGTGNDTLVAGHAANVMTGGQGADTFQFNALPWNAGQITDFTSGSDKIDVTQLLKSVGYSGADPFGDHTLTLNPDSHGGTDLTYNPPGAGSNGVWPTTVVDIDNVAPSSLNTATDFVTGYGSTTGGGSTGTGGSPGSGGSTGTGGATSGPTLTADNSAGQVLTATAPNATFDAGQSSVVMTEDDGANCFIYAGLPWNAGQITNFNPASDTIDISAMLKAAGYTGSDPFGDHTLTFAADGHGGTDLIYNPPGAGSNGVWPITVVDIDNVAASSLNTSTDFITGGSTSGSGSSGSATGSTGGTSSGGGTSGGSTGSGTGATLTANDTAGQQLTATTPSDTFLAGHNSVVMTGDGGANIYAFNALPWNAGQITNFNPAQDTIDVSAILQSVNNIGGDPFGDGTLSLNADGHGGTRLIYHPPGAGSNGIWPTTIVDIDHVTPAQFQARDWLFHH
ncbi:MAG TPA: M10 family metallopeptidase C-terminal domain-containing protein [Rhizomicrobium sp.]|nr:M10 family metallopeptidase C-terminal domain-containing protein [Rhizomicrobium sp.]